MSKRNKNSGRRTGANNVLPVVGLTDDGKRVIDGVYQFHETYGMPLPWLFAWMKDHNMVPNWINFYHEAKTNNMSHNKILNKLTDAAQDTWGSKFATVICNNLTLIFER
ncbi:MAG: hypothetical protein Q8P20_00205 [bacterium]|nr:hypothetical protein [bacterium]